MTLWRHRRQLPLLAEAVLLLAVARLALVVLPFRHIAALLHPRLGGAPLPDDPARVAWAVAAAARRLPWRSVCFDQAMAAQRMLCRRGHAARLHYGVGRPDQAGPLAAHVWLEVDGRVWLGEKAMAGFERIVTFGPTVDAKAR